MPAREEARVPPQVLRLARRGLAAGGGGGRGGRRWRGGVGADGAARRARGEARVPPQVLRLARRRLAAGERLEMGALAAELGVNRVTLYRWVGSRERLLVEVLWSMADEALSTLRSEVPPTADRGGAGVPGVLGRG